jgi:hypothetical protein
LSWAFDKLKVLSSNHFSLMGPVVQSWISPNPGLNFNLLFWLRISACLFISKRPESKTSVDPDKISRKVFPR